MGNMEQELKMIEDGNTEVNVLDVWKKSFMDVFLADQLLFIRFDGFLKLK